MLFLTYPLGLGTYLGFTDTKIGRSGVWIGLENYEFLWGDAVTRLALFNTLFYTFTACVFKFVLGLWLALRTGSGEGVQSQLPLLFFLLFISSMNLPRNLIEVGWFRDLATINPVSYLIEAMRSLVITGWDTQALTLGFGFALALIGISLFLSARQLKVRMART